MKLRQGHPLPPNYQWDRRDEYVEEDDLDELTNPFMWIAAAICLVAFGALCAFLIAFTPVPS